MLGKRPQWFAALVLVLFLPVWAGCSSDKKNTAGNAKKNPNWPDKVVIGMQHNRSVPPQLVYGFMKNIYKDSFPGVNFKKEFAVGSQRNLHTDISKLGDKMGAGEYDIVFLDLGTAFLLLNYGYNRTFPEYTVIAGAQFKEHDLLVNPDIKSLKDLDGKVVGIYNKNHDFEMILNQVLAKEGLKTEALGGKVKVKYGEMDVLYKDFTANRIQACYPHWSKIDPLRTESGKILFDQAFETEFKRDQTYTVVAVSNRFLQKNPGFVKEYLQTYVENTVQSLENPQELINLAYLYFEKAVPKEEIATSYGLGKKPTDIDKTATTYDINLNYARKTYQFIKDAGYMQSLPPFEKIVDVTILNEVLQEKGMAPLQ